MKTDKPILLFDGVCKLCNATVNFIIKRDPKGKFLFTSLQSNTGLELLWKFNFPQTTYYSFIMIVGDNAYDKSTAVLKVTTKLRGLWPLAYFFIIIPKPLRDHIYNAIATRRYKWFGKMDTSMIPTADTRNRFID